MGKIKALALLSGGLDSTLAVKLMLDQGFDVESINFVTPFCLCRKGGCGATEAAEKLGVPLKTVSLGKEYLKMLRNPEHGYGRNMNPCIDCRILILKAAKKYAEQKGISVIFTGEVLGERPMSQHRRALDLIEREAGLAGKILRPLSAKLLPQTEAEEKGWVDREKLLDIRGRSRKKQIELAAQSQITDYPCPSGGCLLTYREFAAKMKDLLEHKKSASLRDVAMLKIGRHFRFMKNKIIVGRNESENKILLNQRVRSVHFFEAQGCGSPITLVEGALTRETIQMAAQLTAFHSDQKSGEVPVNFGKERLNRSLTVMLPHAEEVERVRVKWSSV